jgi:hypothetical protein
LAVLLVSFLIGCGYNAFVVYGYATDIVCNNDLKKIKIDLPKEPIVCIHNIYSKLIYIDINDISELMIKG